MKKETLKQRAQRRRQDPHFYDDPAELQRDLDAEQRALDAKREQRKKARARHWKKTGVSDVTIKWMEENSML